MPLPAIRALLPFLLANITIAANDWHVLGIGLGQALFWGAIGLCASIVWHSPYRRFGTACLVAGTILRVYEAAYPGVVIEALRHVAFAGLFLVTGAVAYGRYPTMLHRQLIGFLALCIPVMLLQMSGAHHFFMYWNTDYAHDLWILSIEEIGTFKQIPLYPTLFVGPDDVYYQIGQGRPSGLLYANNVLSVFVTIAAGLSMAMTSTHKLRFEDVVVAVVVVLTMSLTAAAAVAGLCFGLLLFGRKHQRIHAVKFLVLFGAAAWLYSVVFPGLFERNLSSAKMMGSIYSRGLQLLDLVGVSFLRQMYESSNWYVWDIVDPDATYSGVAKIFMSPFGALAALVAPFLLWLYLRAVRGMRLVSSLAHSCALTGLMCVLSQFGVPYFAAPSFQVIFGFALLPLFTRAWEPEVTAGEPS